MALTCIDNPTVLTDKCGGASMHSYTLKTGEDGKGGGDRRYHPPGIKINDKVITAINQNFAKALSDAEICRYLLAIRNIELNVNNDWNSKASAEGKNALNKAHRFLCKYIKPPSCAEIRETDADKQAEYDECLTKTATHKWSDRDCICKKKRKKKKEVAPEPDEIYGCLEPAADNYFCKEHPGECIDNKPPEEVVGVPCTYSIKVDLKYDYNFCNTKQGCYPENNPYSIDAPYEVITYKNDGSLPPGHFESISASTKEVIENINNSIQQKTQGFLFLEGGKGFYTPEDWPEDLVNDFAKALAVAELKTKNEDEDDTFPFYKVTIFNPASEIIGQFTIYHGTDMNGEIDGITELKPHESITTINYKLQFEIGTSLLYVDRDTNWVNGYLTKHGSKFRIVDGKVTREGMNEESIGLINVLKEEPIGLVKLLK